MISTTLNCSENEDNTIYEWGLWVLWWGRWDLNPGSHAPQACILNHARRRPQQDTCFSEETEQAIIKTLTFLKNNGKSKTVQSQANWKFRQIARGTYKENGQTKQVDLFDPETVKAFIAQYTKEDGTPTKASKKTSYSNATTNSVK